MADMKGELVFFDQLKKMPKPNAPRFGFQGGHGFGIFLGVVPPFRPIPPFQLVYRIIGECGLLKFDDVAEFLGEDMVKICIDKYHKKYYGFIPADPNQTNLPLASVTSIDGLPNPPGDAL